MVSGGMDTNILSPKVIVLPTKSIGLSGAAVGEIFVSGANLYFMSGAHVKLVTATAA